MAAVTEASVFVLCWCCESEQSSFIAKEISAALAEGNKKLVPVLFCSTPLPRGMADRQWIDLRGQILHHCCVSHTPPPPRAVSPHAPLPESMVPAPPLASAPPSRSSSHSSSRSRRLISATLSAAAFALLACVVYLGFTSVSSSPRPPAAPAAVQPSGSAGKLSPSIPTAPPPHPKENTSAAFAESGHWPLIQAAAFAVLLSAILLLILRSVRKKSRLRQRDEIAAAAAAYFNKMSKQ